MPEEEVTRLEANLAQDETAAVRVVRVIHPALRQRAMAAQHGVTPETGELPQEERARHGRHDLKSARSSSSRGSVCESEETPSLFR